MFGGLKEGFCIFPLYTLKEHLYKIIMHEWFYLSAFFDVDLYFSGNNVTISLSIRKEFHMARGVKRPTKDVLNEQLIKAQDKLDKALLMKAAAEDEIKEIQQKLEDLKIEEIKELMEEKGVTIEELKELLNK